MTYYLAGLMFYSPSLLLLFPCSHKTKYIILIILAWLFWPLTTLALFFIVAFLINAKLNNEI